MKKVFTVLAISITLFACKKASSSRQIKVTSYLESPSSFLNVNALMAYYPSDPTDPCYLSDTVVVIVSAPLPAGTQIDTVYILPNHNRSYHDAGYGNVAGQVPCAILSVKSKGSYNFSY